MYTAGEFERHAGLLVARNPYKTIIVTESGKCLDAYRYCTCCHTTETDYWDDGPYGTRTLCSSCGNKYRDGKITEIFLKKLVETSKGVDCRPPSSQAIPKKVGSEHGPNVKPLPKFKFNEFTFELFQEYVLNKRVPVVLTNVNDQLNKQIFTFDYMKENHGDSEIAVRYQQSNTEDESQFQVLKDANKSLKWFLDHAETPNFSEDPDFDSPSKDPNVKVSLYAKDFSFGEVAPEWQADVVKQLPEFLIPHGKHDLMGFLDESTRPIVWMAYVGSDGTRTPLHVDKLATIAFNLHVCGTGMKRWWLVEHNELKKLEDFVGQAGGSFFKDNFWMAPSGLEATNLNMFYHEQVLGELVIVPPMVPHTVINCGGLSCAVAANLMNEAVLDVCWDREKFYRTINRTSIYRIKPTIYFAVKNLLESGDCSRITQKLVDIFEEIVKQEESIDGQQAKLEEGYFACDGCSAEIFNRRYHCSECRTGDYDLCVQCFERFGREHFHPMVLKERIPLENLKELLNKSKYSLLNGKIDVNGNSPTARLSIRSLLN